MANKLTISDSKTLAYTLKFLSELNPDKKWDVDISLHSDSLSVRQRNLYWRWMSDAGSELGYDKDDMAKIFKDKFLMAKAYTDLDGVDRERRLSIKELKVGEMRDFMNAISRFCATDLGIHLPHPEDMQRRG